MPAHLDEHAIRSEVWFRPIPEAVIDQVIARGEIFAHAGGFSITDPLLQASIARLDGTAESVIGLPTALTQRLRGAAEAGVGGGPRPLDLKRLGRENRRGHDRPDL
jgi:predicted house-cleaning NTP pyrophosphatase (Maf/HAM1 superfamily)